MARASIAFALVVALSGCDAKHRDVSAEAPYKALIGQSCEATVTLRAHGYTFNVERDKKTDAVMISTLNLSGPEITFAVSLQQGTKLTLIEARECTNCLFDRNPEYRVHVNPEPAAFGGKPAYLRITSLDDGYVHCPVGPRAT